MVPFSGHRGDGDELLGCRFSVDYSHVSERWWEERGERMSPPPPSHTPSHVKLIEKGVAPLHHPHLHRAPLPPPHHCIQLGRCRTRKLRRSASSPRLTAVQGVFFMGFTPRGDEGDVWHPSPTPTLPSEPRPTLLASSHFGWNVQDPAINSAPSRLLFTDLLFRLFIFLAAAAAAAGEMEEQREGSLHSRLVVWSVFTQYKAKPGNDNGSAWSAFLWF